MDKQDNILKMINVMQENHRFRDNLLADRHRPGYHFACPEAAALPGDPNGGFYANGRYHLMYLYDSCYDRCHYGHISSADLVHWRYHPDALSPDASDDCIYSGGSYVDENGRVYLTYRGLGSERNGNREGIRIAYSDDIENHYTKWYKIEGYAVEADTDGMKTITDKDGRPYYAAVSDPSNIWKSGDCYYMQSGNYHPLHTHGLENEKDPCYVMNYVELYRSHDLKNWEYLHRFYEKKADNITIFEDEDAMCTTFLPLPDKEGKPTGKYLQTFISHNHGCQYYIGIYNEEDQKFIPEKHGRMSWEDKTYFAPEALTAPDGRQLMWVWVVDNRPDEWQNYGWCGIYGLPRSLWLNDDGELGMAPVKELTALRYNHKSSFDKLYSDSCELKFTASVGMDDSYSFYVKASDDNKEYTEIGYDGKNGFLYMDTLHSGTDGRKLIEKAPFRLKDGEELSLNVYIDKAVVEVYANDRQAICRRAYPDGDKSKYINFPIDTADKITTFDYWEMMPSNMY